MSLFLSAVLKLPSRDWIFSTFIHPIVDLLAVDWSVTKRNFSRRLVHSLCLPDEFAITTKPVVDWE